MTTREKIISIIAVILLIALILSFLFQPKVKVITIDKESKQWRFYYEMARGDYENLVKSYNCYQDSVKSEIKRLQQQKHKDSVMYIESIGRVMGMEKTELAKEFTSNFINDTGVVILPLRESGALNAIITKIKLDDCRNSSQVREKEIGIMRAASISDKKLISELRGIISESGDKYSSMLDYAERLESENTKLIVDYENEKLKNKRVKGQRNISIGILVAVIVTVFLVK